MSDHPNLPREDSAGVTFSGRTLGATPFAGDTGETPEGLAIALLAFQNNAVPGPAEDAKGARSVGAGAIGDPVEESAKLERLAANLAGARVFVPIVAVLGETETGIHGVRSDKNADMALVTVTSDDGRKALPIFSSVEELVRWNPDARPIPVEVERAALSAVSEGCDVLVVNPAHEAVVLPRSAMWALGRGEPWLPAFKNDAVLEVVKVSVSHEPNVVAFHCAAGYRGVLRLALTLRAGLTPDVVRELVGRVQKTLSTSDVIAQSVDGLELKLLRDPSA